MESIQTGRYKHYKGKEYEVIGLARHSETLEPLVIYKALYDSNNTLFARPLAMFTEDVKLNNGESKPRFEHLESMMKQTDEPKAQEIEPDSEPQPKSCWCGSDRFQVLRYGRRGNFIIKCSHCRAERVINSPGVRVKTYGISPSFRE